MDKFFVNPGSATGAFSTGWGTAEGEEGEVVPSFCLMDVSRGFFCRFPFSLTTACEGWRDRCLCVLTWVVCLRSREYHSHSTSTN